MSADYFAQANMQDNSFRMPDDIHVLISNAQTDCYTLVCIQLTNHLYRYWSPTCWNWWDFVLIFTIHLHLKWLFDFCNVCFCPILIRGLCVSYWVKVLYSFASWQKTIQIYQQPMLTGFNSVFGRLFVESLPKTEIFFERLVYQSAIERNSLFGVEQECLS